MQDQNLEKVAELEYQKALSSACRMLAIREHSEKQIRQKLSAKGFSSQILDPCINYLIKENWLSESRFCAQYIASKADKGQGEFRIVSELKKLGLDQMLIDKALDDEAIDWQECCERALAKKLGSSGIREKEVAMSEITTELSHPLPLNKRIKIEKFLRYRGFSNQQIQIAIKAYLSKTRSFKQ